MIWCPTSDGAVVDYRLALPRGAGRFVTAVELTPGGRHGVSAQLPVRGSEVRLTVTERPRIILLD